MSYYGEKGKFSYRDSFCEEISEPDIGEIAELGGMWGRIFGRIALGTDNPEKYSELYAIAGGMSKSGADIFIINDVMPVFRYGIHSTDCKCGIYICGEKKLKLMFFDCYGIPMDEKYVKKICSESENVKNISGNGKISQILHIRELYLNSVRDSIGRDFSGSAVVSCGKRNLAEIWRNFFSSENGDIIFQVSENGERVNCYSTELGFISYERLILACGVLLWKNGQKIILPKNFHYAAEELASDLNAEYEYQNGFNHKKVFEQRFTTDPLYLCVKLMSCGKSIADVMRGLPQFYTAKREIFAEFSMREPERNFTTPKGRINICRSGKNLLTLTAQSMNAETAAELCGQWENLILKRKNNLHKK